MNINKAIILIFLSLITGIAFSQNDTLPLPPPPPDPNGSCVDGIQEAIADANKGKYKLLSYGYPMYEDWDFESFYEFYVEEKYGIIIGNGGCVVFENTQCYNDTMAKIIFHKFGDDIFEKARAEAEIAYDSVTQKRIQSGYVFDHVDTYPTFKGGKDSLVSYLMKNLSYEGNTSGKVLVSFVVEQNGEISNIVIRKGLNEEADQEVIRVLNAMPKWNPGTYHNQPVRVRMGIPISFKGYEEK